MEDEKIIGLFKSRDETSVTELSRKYGSLFKRVAQNILGDFTEAEECVNDTYMRVWEAIPPAEPKSLCAFSAAITRNLALMRLRMSGAKKRGGGAEKMSFEELDDFVSGNSSVEGEAERRELIGEINAFLYKLPENQRQLFIRRYWGCVSIADLARRFGMTESNVTVTLTRVRKKLKAHLVKRGFEV